MNRLKIASALLSVALLATPAFAQDFVDQKVQELFGQGYTHFEISRGALRTEIEAYGPDFTKLELVISNSDGSVISETTEVQTPEEYQQNIDGITQSDDDGEDDNGDDDIGEDDNGGPSADANDDRDGDNEAGDSTSDSENDDSNEGDSGSSEDNGN